MAKHVLQESWEQKADRMIDELSGPEGGTGRHIVGIDIATVQIFPGVITADSITYEKLDWGTFMERLRADHENYMQQRLEEVLPHNKKENAS